MKANVIQVFPFNIDKIKLLTLRGPKGETGYPTPEQVQAAVDAWLEEHPEATTTVQDGAITTVKLADNSVTEDKLSESLQSLLITDTASGSIASFTDGSDGIPVRDLSVNVEPKQDLHGYANPWPGGGGKNLLPNNATSATLSNVTYTVNSDGTIIANGTSNGWNGLTLSTFELKAGSYILSSGLATGNSNLYLELAGTGIQSKNTTGGEVAFTIDSDLTVTVKLYARPNTAHTNEKVSPMIRLSSVSDASYAPYSNICPITGWENVKVTRTAQNVFDVNIVPGKTIDGDGTVSDNGERCATVDYIPVNANTLYYLSYAETFYNGVFFYQQDKTFISFLAWGGVPRTFTTPNQTAFVRFSFMSRTVPTNVKLELYDTLTIPLGSTVYGGTLDVSTGVLTVEKVGVLFKDLKAISGVSASWNYDSTNNTFSTSNTIIPNGTANADTGIVTSCYASRPYGYNSSYSGENAVIWGHTTGSLRVRDNRYTDVNEWKSAVADETIVYPLATPTTVQLTAQQLTTLLGQNNIFADCGNVDVDYVADTKLYIAKMIANALNA